MSLAGVCRCWCSSLLIGFVSCILRECSYGPLRAVWCVMLVVMSSDLWCYSFVCVCLSSCVLIACRPLVEIGGCLLVFGVLCCVCLLPIDDVG